MSNDIKPNEASKYKRTSTFDTTALVSTFTSSLNAVLPTIFSNTPEIGSVIAASLTAVGAYVGSRRMRELNDSIQSELSLVDETKIEKRYFDTEEFFDVFRRVLENTIRTRDCTKIRLYARILVRIPILDNAEFRHTAEDFLLILLELSPADLSLAREVFKQQKDLPEEYTSIEQDELKGVKESGWDDLPNILGMNKSQFSLSVAKLVRAGLLRQVIGTYQSYIGDAYSITPAFRTLIKLVEKLE
jgi:hypothetical protein